MKKTTLPVLFGLLVFAATTVADGTPVHAGSVAPANSVTYDDCLEQVDWCEARAFSRMSRLEARKDSMELRRFVRAEKRIRAQKEECMRKAMEPCEG